MIQQQARPADAGATVIQRRKDAEGGRERQGCCKALEEHYCVRCAHNRIDIWRLYLPRCHRCPGRAGACGDLMDGSHCLSICS